MSIEKILKKVILIVSCLFLILSVVLFFVFLFNRNYFNSSFQLDVDLAEKFGAFFSGLVGTSATIAGSLLVVLVFLYQNQQFRVSKIENTFYKMVDYHRENLRNMEFSTKNETFSGQKAFVNFKLYLFKCQNLVKQANQKLTNQESDNQGLPKEEILDLSFMIFFFGIDLKWKSFSDELLAKYKKYPHLLDELYRLAQKDFNLPNQTALSTYFRNLYNAISLIDGNNDLSQKEKYNYIKSLRAQLSNNELCLLYFDIMSRYGTKWRKKHLVEKYKFLKNLPPKFCNGFEPKDDFKLEYESEEYN
ncbi:putative phage abortive infection protein [Fibrobacter intestinalis]|uniref:Putative phage abortive infection protein n=1 Tax=Fibrobacter intestinalis TaxID=28122 RepID=A0A1T4L936_9BACT|nr:MULTISPECIES: putative phage abortive infection protein [Fibrobacter]PBC73981.1 putative phage abortive infection protein [Fibrobacter sp. NR9]SJZ51088.1 Putative phage abortive infection protein [Fibrobacter intestinalis]